MLDLREIRGAVTGLALVAAFFLVAVSVDFGIPGQALLQTLRFHIAGLLVLAIVALLLTGAWRRSLVLGAACAISLAEGGYFVYRQQSARAQLAAEDAAPLLKVLSFNILGSNHENGETIARFIEASGADVVVVMEAAPIFGQLEALAATYPARVGCDSDTGCDLVLMSRTPLGRVERHSLGPYWRNRLITAETIVGGETVALVAAHMVKPYFDSASVAEAHVLSGILDGLGGPLVLAGDFNAAPWSDNIHWLTQDAELLPGPAYPATWPVPLGPAGVPIDNIFTRAPLLVTSVTALPDAMGSNHRGITAEIALAAPPAP